MSTVNIPTHFGAILLGGLFSSLLTGTVTIQAIIYTKMYPTDPPRLRLLVLGLWSLDILHSCFIWIANWTYMVQHYGDSTYIDYIPWSIALSVILTAALTLIVHCFFAHRIFLLSKKNWYLTIPILILALLRLVSTAEMIRLESFHEFEARYKWVFTLGLSMSTIVDVLITGSLFFLLQSNRNKSSVAALNAVIDSLILYAFETGLLTSVGTVITLIFWLSMDNLVFMGIHFVIGKCYAISLLVTLNTRESIRNGRSVTSGEADGNAILVMETRRNRTTNIPFQSQITSEHGQGDFGKRSELQINVERSVQYATDSLSSNDKDRRPIV